MNFKRYVESSDTWIDSHYIRGTSTDTLTLPQTIYGDGTNATLTIKGNTTQSGTPSPSTPVDVVGCGKMSSNMFNVETAYSSYYMGNGTVRGITSAVCNNVKNYFTTNDIGKEITISVNAAQITASRMYITASIGGVASTSNSINQGQTGQFVITVTPTSTDDYWKFTYGSSATGYCELYNFMVNVGSTALPYEPYGQYKIPILINGNITNIYIGDNPLRKSLDGTAYDTLAADGTLTQRVDSDGSVLATPVVTQITMPTFTLADGANSLSVDTTVQPSEVTANYHGWHPVSSAHESSGGQWD